MGINFIPPFTIIRFSVEKLDISEFCKFDENKESEFAYSCINAILYGY